MPSQTTIYSWRNPATEKEVAAEMVVSRQCSFCGRTLLKETTKMSTKQDTAKVRLVLATPNEKPLFAPEFIKVVKDAAYETLRNYLLQAGAKPEAVALFDDLVLTYGWDVMQANGRVSWIVNQSMTEALGAMSYNITALGGLEFMIEK
jgi:hypothetical protein